MPSRRRLAAYAALSTLILLVNRAVDTVQRMLLYHPQRSKHDDMMARSFLEHAQQVLPIAGYKVREFSYSLRLGVLGLFAPLKQRGFIIMPSSKCNIGKLWVVYGGNAMAATDWLPFVEGLVSKRPAAAADAPQAAFLLLDYPGYGVNEGSPSTALALRSAEAAVRASLEVLQEEGFARARSIAFLGHSLGCAAVAQLAARFASTRPRWLGDAVPASRLVLSAPFTSIPQMGLVIAAQIVSERAMFAARALIAAVGAVSQHTWDNERSLRTLARAVARRPGEELDVTLLHGTRDEIVPVRMSHALRGLADKVGLKSCALIERPRAGHNDILEEAFSEYFALVWKEDSEPAEPSKL